MSKKLITAASVALLAAGAQAFSAKDAVEVVAGMINGAIKGDDLTEMQKCVQNTETLEVGIEAAVADLKKGGIHNIVDGIMALGKVYQQLPSDLASCEDIQGDL